VAKAQIKLPNDFAERLSKLGNKTDEIIPRVLEAGGEVVLEKVKSNLESALSGESTGKLSRSLELSKARLNRGGNYDLKVGFSEPRLDGGSNAKIANILEFGKHGQPPKPSLRSPNPKRRALKR
jgi:hypothetical protein